MSLTSPSSFTWVLTDDGLCNDSGPDEVFSQVLSRNDLPKPEEFSFYDTIEKSYDLPAGQYAIQVFTIGFGLDCDSLLDGKYRISIIDELIPDVPVTTEFDNEEQSMEDLKKSYMTKYKTCQWWQVVI